MNRTQLIDQQRRYLSFLPHVRKQFGNIPGVHIIGLGAKERNGEILEEWAFRFYVEKKKPLDKIPRQEKIPEQIFNIQTDVISFFDKENLICEDCETDNLTINKNEYRNDGIRGGISIRNEYFDNDHPAGYGTLGILARRKSDDALVGLTCAHVVNAGSESNTTLDIKIGQPKYWISCCCCPRGYIGDVKKATFTNDLDCAFIEIHEDIQEKVTDNSTENMVEGIMGDISGAGAILCFDTLKKYGRSTGVTEGKVSDIAFGTNHMLIERTGGDNDDPFACHGDSGAVIVNSSNQVVGLLVAARKDDMTRAIATHIKPVMTDLGITIAGTDAADIGEPVGGGVMGCEVYYWPGGQAESDLNPVESFSSSDFDLTGNVNWDVSKGAPGAVIVENGSQTANNLSSITVRYDNESSSKNPSDAVWVEATKTGEPPVTKFRTVFKITTATVNTSNVLDADNVKRFDAVGGTDNQAGVGVPGTDGATQYVAKAEITFEILPADLDWFGKGVLFQTGNIGGSEGLIIARRETKFTKGEQADGAANRTHTDQAEYISAGDSSLNDFQEAFVDSPGKIFRLANEGFDPANLLQGYERADYRDYIEFHNGTEWKRISPYAEWFANLTAALSGTGSTPPSAGTPNVLGAGENSENIPNQSPTLTVSDFQEVKPGELVTVSATPADADNDVVTVNWAQTDGPNVALSSPTGNSVTFNAPANDPQLKFTATADDGTGPLLRTAGNHLSASSVVTINVVEWLDRDGGSANTAENETEVFNAADFGIGAGPLNWDVTTGGTDAIIIEADGVAVGPTGTVNGASTIKVRYDQASADNTRTQSIKIQGTHPGNGKIWYKRRTVRVIEWLQSFGGYPSNADNETEVFASADLGIAGPVDWDVSTGGTNAVIVETGSDSAPSRPSITVRFDNSSADGTRANTVIIKATDPGDAANYNYKRRSVMKVTLSLRNTGTIEASPEFEDYANCTGAAGGIDDLGPLPMGDGRGDFPDEAYTSPVLVVADVEGNMSTTVFRWKRFITRRSWIFEKNGAGTQWEVEQRSRRGFPDDDTGAATFNDASPSVAHNRLYIYDNSALLPASGSSAALSVDEFVNEEKNFTYQVDFQRNAVWLKITEKDVGQIITAKRKDTTGTVSSDWTGIENSTALRTVSATITEAEVRAIVGGALPIVLDANANN